MRVTKLVIVPAEGIGLPDYSAPKPTGAVPVGPIYTSSDVGELAARLGSPMTFDRRGNVLWFDNFEDSLARWTWAAAGVGGGVTLSTLRTKRGPISARLVTGNVIGNQTHINREFPKPYPDMLGFEVSFTIIEQVSPIIFEVEVDDGTDTYWISIRYTFATQRLEYRGTDGLWHLITVIMMPSSFSWLHTMKMVFNQSTGRYSRLLWDSNEYDLSTIDSQFVAAAGSWPSIWVTINGAAAANLNTPMYVADVIFTQNEPVSIVR